MRLGRRKALLVGGLLLVALGIIVVRAGIPDALFKAAPEEIDVEAGPFESLLRARIESIGGGYKVVVARGPAWPADPGALRTLEAAFETNAEIAALRIVASGDALFLRMEDREGEILDEREISLRGLVEDDGARVEAAMPGRRRAARLRLSIASGLPSPR